MQKPIKVGLCHSLQNSFKSTKPACLSAYQSFFDPLHSAWLTVSIGGGRVAGGCAGGGMGLVSSWGLRTPLWACWAVTGVQWVAELALVDGTHLGMAPLSLWASGVASMLFSVHPALSMCVTWCLHCASFVVGGQQAWDGDSWRLTLGPCGRYWPWPTTEAGGVIWGSDQWWGQGWWWWEASKQHGNGWQAISRFGLGWAPRVGHIYLHNAHKRIMCDQI